MKRETMRTVYSALALVCAAGLAAAARADATWKGVDGVFSSDDNWWDAMPATNETARFTGDSAGSFVTMDAAHNVGYIWVGDTADAKATYYISTDMSTTNCVTFTAQSPECGMTSAGNFACADGEGQRGALTIESGTYSATGFAYWGWGPSVKFVANLNGGDVNINGANGSIGFFTGWGANNVSTFNLAGGNLAVANDISVESGDTTTYTTFNISNGSTLSCGTASTAKWMKIPTSGTGNIAINLDAGGTLSAWHLRHQSTGMTRINFNGGTFHVLGNIGYGIVGYDNGANASTFVMELKSGGGTIATDFNVGINNPVTGSGSFTKAGTGTLTFDVMPSFTGTITVPQGCGTVVLPSGATIAAGTDTATRTLSSGQVEYYYYHSEAMNDNIFTAGANCTITLDGEATINITKAVTIGALNVTGTGTLNIAGSGKVTATSLQIGAGATVVLPDGMTLTNPNSPLYVKNDSVSGAGVIAYTGVAPDSLASYADGSSWSGTVWIRALAFTDWNPSSSSYGNSLSTLRLSGCSGRFAKAQIAVPYAIELENSGYSSALNLTNGYSFNSSGAWSYFFTPELKGTGTLAANGTGGTLFVAQTCGDFAGVFSLSGKTVWLGYDAPNSEYDEDKTEGVRSGAVRIKEGVEVGMGGAWTLSKLVGSGTVRMLAPYYASSSFGTAVSDSSLWTGTVVLAAQTATALTAVWPARMGNANSVIRFEGLSSNGGTHYFGDNTAVAARVYLDGDVTIDNGSSGVTYTLGTVSGTGNLTVAPAGLGGSMAVTITKLEDYTGTLAGLASKGIVNVAGVVMDAVPVEGDKLFSVSTQENYRNVYASPLNIYVGGATYSGSTTLDEDGYYLSYAGRGLYWVGPEGGYWDEDANWRLADGSATKAPRASCVDIVYFTNTASVVVKSHAYAYQVNIAADASLTLQSESSSAYLRPYEITGEGVLRLAGGWIGSTGQPLVVNCDVEVVKDTTNYLACNSGYRVELHGSLTGSGTLIANHAGAQNIGASFYGDNSNFAGTFETTNYNNRDATYFNDWHASSSNAVWKVNAIAATGTHANRDIFPSGDGEYKYFGAFVGSMCRQNGANVEIGARSDVESSLYPRSWISRAGYNIRKVGRGILNLRYANASNFRTHVTALEVTDGTVVLEHEYMESVPDYGYALGTVTFTGEGGYLRTPVYKENNSDVSPDVSSFIVNSTAPIGFDTNGETITLTNAISATNMGGLRKKGAGTLVLTAVPKFSGPVIVEEGTLTLPVGTSASGLSLGANGILQLDLGNYSGTGIIFAAPKVAGSVPFTTDNIRVVNAPAGITVTVSDSSVLIMSGSGSIRRWTGEGKKTQIVEDTEAAIEVDDPDWNNPGNWKDNTVPESSDTVMFTDVAPGFTLTNDVSVASLLVDTGDPDKTGFTYSADCALNVLGSMTIQYPGALSVSGSGSLDVTGSMIGVTGVAMTPTNATIAIAKSHPYYSERIMANNDLGLTSLDGAGTISSGADQTITIAKNKESTFYGTFTGAMGLVKDGEGTLVLQGPNSFTGDIDIREGTLKVARYDYSGLVAYDIDASATDGWTMTDSSVSRITTTKGLAWPWECTTTSPATLTTDYFDGKDSLQFYASTRYDPKNSGFKRSYSTITVCKTTNDVSTTQHLHCYSSDQDYIKVSSGFWLAHCYTNDVSSYLYIDGGNGDRTATVNKKTVVSLVREYAYNNNRQDSLGNGNGTGFLGAIAQVVGFKAYVSPEVRAAVEAYLMQKWGCDDATQHQILPATAALTMASADVELDLGGMTQTVKSFTGAGYIHNGILRTADGRVVVTGELEIPAARGTTYFLDASASDTLILTGSDPAEFEDIKFDFPSGAKAIPRVAIPVGIWEDSEANAKFLAAVTTKVDNWSVSHRIIYNEEYMVFRYGAYPFFIRVR